MIKNVILIAIFFVTFGCATIHHGPSVCDNHETMQASWLCQAAAGVGVPLEEFGYIILDAESIALITEDITAEQVDKFCDDMRLLLLTMQGAMSYSGFISAAIDDAESRAIFSILSRRLMIFRNDSIISDVDIGFLLWHLDMVKSQVQF